MNIPRNKTPKLLSFDFGDPLGLGLSKGYSGGVGASDSFSPLLRFSLRQPTFPDNQVIWLSPTSEDDDNAPRIEAGRKSWRNLTDDIEGSISFVTRELAIIEDESETPTSTIGTFSYVPAFTSSEYGHVESYGIELNLNEKEFNEIRDLFLRGKSPSKISIWTPDIEYGFAPDGREKVWAVLESKYPTFAKIVGFSISFSTQISRVEIGRKKTKIDEDNEREEMERVKTAILHSREDIQLLCFGQNAINASLLRLRRQTSILIAIAVVIMILIGFRV